MNISPCFSFTEYNPYLSPYLIGEQKTEKFLRNFIEEIYRPKFLEKECGNISSFVRDVPEHLPRHYGAD